MKAYVVFMCSRCQHFTNAPLGQKRRRCSYCGHIINIEKAQKALFENQSEAIEAVQQFNIRGSQEFEAAVEQTRERILHYLPETSLNIEEIAQSDDAPLLAGKTKRLMSLLRDLARDKPCNLDEIEKSCPKYGLEWSWVESQLTKMANSGAVIFPQPWTVQLIHVDDVGNVKKRTVKSSRDIAKMILEYIKNKGGEIQVKKLEQYCLTRGVSQGLFEKSLDKLLDKGVVYFPDPSRIKLV